MPYVVPDPGPLAQMNLGQREADLDRIAKLEDPVLRNLLITQRYHDLAQELGRVLGFENSNWSNFATYASKTAGQSIREEMIPPDLVAFLRDEAKLEQKLDHFYQKVPALVRVFLPKLSPFDLARAIIARVASEIAEGNLIVYAELTPLFARFVDRFVEPENRTEENAQAFADELDAGPAAQGGQDDLKTAFKAYVRAASLPDGTEKAQLMLFGNVLIGLHEQTRLQPKIAGGIDAPFSDEVYDNLFSTSPVIVRGLFRWLSKAAVNLFALEFRDEWQRIMTRFMMKLSAPGGEKISLGQDLPPGEFPRELLELTYGDLIFLMKKYDHDLSTTKGCAAVDWVKLTDRMRFIGELFRVEQQATQWFNQPFLDAQRQSIESDVVPPGPLG